MKKLLVLALLGLALCGACTQTQPRPLGYGIGIEIVDSLGNNVFPYDPVNFPLGYPFTMPFDPYKSFWIDSRGNQHVLYASTTMNGIRFGTVLEGNSFENEVKRSNNHLVWVLAWSDSLKRDTLEIFEPDGLNGLRAKYILFNKDTISNAEGYLPTGNRILLIK